MEAPQFGEATEEEIADVRKKFKELDQKRAGSLYWKDVDDISFDNYPAQYYVARDTDNSIIAALIANFQEENGILESEKEVEIFYLANFSTNFEGITPRKGLGKQLLKKYIESREDIETFLIAPGNLSLAIVYAGWAQEIENLKMAEVPAGARGGQINNGTKDARGEALLKQVIADKIPNAVATKLVKYLFTKESPDNAYTKAQLAGFLKQIASLDRLKRLFQKIDPKLAKLNKLNKKQIIKALQLACYVEAYKSKKASGAGSSSQGESKFMDPELHLIAMDRAYTMRAQKKLYSI